MQQLMLDTLIAGADHAPVIEAVRETLANAALDAAFVGEAVLLPSEAFIGDQMDLVDPDLIRSRREALRADLGRSLESQWRDAYAANAANRFAYNPAAMVARRLRSVARGGRRAAGAGGAPK